MVRDFAERAGSLGHQLLTKEASVYAKEYGLDLQLKYLDPGCVTEEGVMVPGAKLKNVLRKDRESRLQKEFKEQKWQGKLVIPRQRDEELSIERYFWWLSDWRACQTHTRGHE